MIGIISVCDHAADGHDCGVLPGYSMSDDSSFYVQIYMAIPAAPVHVAPVGRYGQLAPPSFAAEQAADVLADVEHWSARSKDFRNLLTSHATSQRKEKKSVRNWAS